MLEYLTIKGFAIIDELAMPFKTGLTVLTGETGAGKSIIVDALKAVLGEKTDQGAVRTGDSSARVEAAFSAPELQLPEGVDPEGEIIIAREIRREGRGRATVNGSMINISQLKDLGDHLVDLHGQHEHQSLLKNAVHLEALDSFGSLDGARQEFSDVFMELSRVREQLENSRKDERERIARLDYLRYTVSELESAGLGKDEEEILKNEAAILSSAEKLRQAASAALQDIYQADGSSVETVSRYGSDLRNLMDTDARLGEAVQLMENAVVQMEEAGHFLRDYISALQADPDRLEEIQERLSFLTGLKKKYGPSIQDVMSTLEEGRSELALLENGEMDIDALKSQEAKLAERAGSLADELGRLRREHAVPLEESVRKELRDLAMDKVRFSVSFDVTTMSETGIDQVEFLISPNPGEPLMPLRKIASGGELSRVMLALKRILAGAHEVPTLVFDEVDAGIGGRVAAVLGRKLQDIAQHHQVLCITHLAPVAAYAHNHVVVEKNVEEGRTIVRTRYLQDHERIEELARMMGGLEVSSGIVKSARELLEEARG